MKCDNDEYIIELNKLPNYGWHVDNEACYYDDNDNRIEFPWLRCVGIGCNHKFILNNNYSDGTIYLLCPDCNTFTSCESYECEFDDDVVFWKYTCKDCHGNNPYCDCDTNCTPDGCGHCGDQHDCGDKPCIYCINEYGEDNYDICDITGYWTLKDSAQKIEKGN